MAQVDESRVLVFVETPRASKRDYLFILLLLLLLLSVGILLFQDLRSSISTSGRPVAKLSFRENRVERKIGGQALWSTIGAPDQIFNYDSIRTDENSEAKLSLNTGTEITLSDTALVTIIVDEGEIAVGLEGGNVVLDSNGDNQAISVKSASGTLRLENGGKAVLNQGEDGLSIDVTEGDAQFVETDGTVSTVSANQTLIQGPGGVLTRSNPFTLTEPGPASLLLSFEDSLPVKFAWRMQEGTVANVIEISSVGDFSRDVQRYNLADAAQTFQINLEVGHWYWRISNEEQTSSVGRFLIIHEQRPEPFAPEDDDIFYYIKKSPLIRLQWQSSKNAPTYKIKIFEGQDLTNPFKEFTAQSSFISLDDLPEGNFTWQVEATYTAFNQVVQSRFVSFGIKKFEEDKIPDPEILLDGDKISQYALRKDGVIIRWKAVGELERYLVELSKGDRTIYKEVVKRTYLELPRDLVIGDDYGIEIAALNGEEEVSSNQRNFEVVSFIPVEIILPKRDAKIYDDIPELDFSWRDKNNATTGYFLEVSPFADFSEVDVEEKTKSRFLTIPTLDTGFYYVKVSILIDGDEFAKSVIVPFELERRLQPKPVVVRPAPQGTVDITVTGELKIIWNSVFDTSFYRLSVTPVAAPSAAVALNVFGLSWTAPNPQDLPTGLYRYNLTSFASNRIGEIFQNSEITYGIFYLLHSRLSNVSEVEIFQ